MIRINGQTRRHMILIRVSIIIVKNEPVFHQVLKTFKKLVSVLTTSMLITKASKKDKIVLKKIPCIYYLLHFCKDKEKKMQALIDSGSKVNIMTLMHTLKLGLKV